MKATLNQIISAFEIIAVKHANISSFFANNNVGDIVNSVKEYPLLFVQLDNVTPSETQLQYNLTACILTKPEHDESDIISVYSDTIQILNDVLILLEDQLNLEITFGQINPVHNVTGDNVSGCNIAISISTSRVRCVPLKCD